MTERINLTLSGEEQQQLKQILTELTPYNHHAREAIHDALFKESISFQHLEKAVMSNCTALAEFCLQKGISPENPVQNCCNMDMGLMMGNLLCRSIRERKPDIRQLLLRYKANPNGSAYENSLGAPLLCAINHHDFEAVKDLMNARADVSSPIALKTLQSDKQYGVVSPIYRALEIYYKENQKDERIVRLLMNKDPHFTDGFSLTHDEDIAGNSIDIIYPCTWLITRHNDWKMARHFSYQPLDIQKIRNAYHLPDSGYEKAFAKFKSEDALEEAICQGNRELMVYWLQNGGKESYLNGHTEILINGLRWSEFRYDDKTKHLLIQNLLGPLSEKEIHACIEKALQLSPAEKIAPHGENALLLQKLAITGELYYLACRENADVVQAWSQAYQSLMKPIDSRHLTTLATQKALAEKQMGARS